MNFLEAHLPAAAILLGQLINLCLLDLFHHAAPLVVLQVGESVVSLAVLNNAILGHVAMHVSVVQLLLLYLIDQVGSHSRNSIVNIF